MIVKLWPFRGWAIYLIGDIQPTSSEVHKYTLVGIDYFSKWFKVYPLINVDQEAVISFIQNHIIYRFGISETLTTDQGTIFTGRKMVEFALDPGVKLLTFTPYYTKVNGQVSATNKIKIGIIKRHVGQNPRNWHKNLDQLLWACLNYHKESTDSTPFRLIFGHDAVFLVEIYLYLTRIQRQCDIPSGHWNMMLDELVYLDKERLVALNILIRQKE